MSISLKILFSVWMGISFVIFLPLCIYYFSKFYGMRSHPYIHTRHPTYLFISVISILIYNNIIIPLLILTEILNIVYINSGILWTIWTTGYIMVMISFHIRLWQIVYDLNYNEQMNNIIWMKELNPMVINRSFYIRNKPKYGVFKFYFGLYIITSVVSFVVGLIVTFVTKMEYKDDINIDYHYFARILWICITVNAIANIPTWFAYHKMNKYNDKVNIKAESKPFLILSSVAIFTLIFTSLFWILDGCTENSLDCLQENQDRLPVFSIYYLMCPSFGFYLSVIIQSIKVLSYISNNSQKQIESM